MGKKSFELFQETKGKRKGGEKEERFHFFCSFFRGKKREKGVPAKTERDIRLPSGHSVCFRRRGKRREGKGEQLPTIFLGRKRKKDGFCTGERRPEVPGQR